MPVQMNLPGPGRQLAFHPVGATASTVYTDSGTGTITLSGSGTESQTHTSSSSGTITLSGTRTESQTQTGSGSGTITLSGTFTESASAADSGSGTITLSGTGTELFVPPGGITYTSISNWIVLRRKGRM